MSLDSLDFEDGGTNTAGEAAQEQSEKQKERSSKAIAGITRSRKDESKGRKATNILSHFLIELLKKPEYDVFIDPIFEALHKNIPSSYLIGILALISHRASDVIRSEYDSKMDLIKSEPIPEATLTPFNHSNLREDFRNRINEWIEDIFLVTTKDPSSILTQKFLVLIEKKEPREAFIVCLDTALYYFFNSKNISISSQERRNFSLFILSELEKKIRSISLEEI